tara:strand:- start:7503 stop:8366 length:864 start_codon:yes stop_codon:yes gene_type:complete
MKNTNKLKLGIIGHGFVGKATDWGFDQNVKKFIVDPIYKTSIDQLSEFDPHLIFICVPTPMRDDGTQETDILETVVKEASRKCRTSLIVIKSTVLPSVLNKLESFNRKLIYNPEFLREKFANEDFVDSKMIIFGGNREVASIVSRYYLQHSRCKTKKHIFLDLSSASLIKYAINTFLATKVVFFNEIFDIFKENNSNDSWEDIISVISTDERIGKSHMHVPGHDGKLGFGGACFPKDSSAFIRFSEQLNKELSVLSAAVRKNNEIRRQYSKLDKREEEQNISFDDKI